MKGACVMDMVWSSFLTAFALVIHIHKDVPLSLPFLIGFVLCFIASWKGYRTANHANNDSKLHFFKCYKIFRMIVMIMNLIFGLPILYTAIDYLLLGAHPARGYYRFVGLVSLAQASVCIAASSCMYFTDRDVHDELEHLKKIKYA